MSLDKKPGIFLPFLGIGPGSHWVGKFIGFTVKLEFFEIKYISFNSESVNLDFIQLCSMYNIYKGTDGRQKGLNNIKNPN